jgi:hypothetical protein
MAATNNNNNDPISKSKRFRSSTSTKEEFLKDLLDLFKNNKSGQFNKWLEQFFLEQPYTTLECHHCKLPLSDEVPCITRGIVDKGKAMGWKKSTIWNSACDYLRLDPGDTQSKKYKGDSTKIRVHKLAILMSVVDHQGFAEELLESDKVIGHRCGCGVCGAECNCGLCSSIVEACTEPRHLRLITQEQNRDETAYHKLIKKAIAMGPDQYVALIKIFKEIKCEVF